MMWPIIFSCGLLAFQGGREFIKRVLTGLAEIVSWSLKTMNWFSLTALIISTVLVLLLSLPGAGDFVKTRLINVTPEKAIRANEDHETPNLTGKILYGTLYIIHTFLWPFAHLPGLQMKQPVLRNSPPSISRDVYMRCWGTTEQPGTDGDYRCHITKKVQAAAKEAHEKHFCHHHKTQRSVQ